MVIQGIHFDGEEASAALDLVRQHLDAHCEAGNIMAITVEPAEGGDRMSFGGSAMTARMLLKMIASARKLLSHGWATDENEQFNTRSEHFQVLVRIIEEFAGEVRADGAHPVVVVFADNYSYKLPYFDKTGLFMHEPLLVYLDNAGIDYVDVGKSFLEIANYDIDALIPGHYSAEGNRIAAAYLDRELAPLVRRVLQQRE